MDHARVEAVTQWLADRLSEKSTYVGLGMLVTVLLGHSIAPEYASALDAMGMGVGGLLAVLVKDKVL